MACAYLFAGSSAAQALTSGANVSFGSAIHGFGVACGSRIIGVAGTAINLDPGYYDVQVAATVTDSDPGNVTLTLYQDGTAIPVATGSEAIAAADDPASIAISAGVVVPRCSTSALTLVVTTSAGAPTVNDIAVTVTKVR